jgi:hypothetical protein
MLANSYQTTTSQQQYYQSMNSPNLQYKNLNPMQNTTNMNAYNQMDTSINNNTTNNNNNNNIINNANIGYNSMNVNTISHKEPFLLKRGYITP